MILDHDLASIYGVTTKRLNEQISRNPARFPDDFLFRLSPEEATECMRSQIATASQKLRNRRYSPFAFTEHGAIMAATVLSSSRAIRHLMAPVTPEKRGIGFAADIEPSK